MLQYCLTFLAATLMIFPAHAAVVFDNGDPGPFDGVEMTSFVEADDFRVGSRTRIESASIYVAGTADLSFWDTGLRYWIFDDASGSPGSILTTGDVSVSIAPTDFEIFFSLVSPYRYSFDLVTPFTAEAATTYWLGIYAIPPTGYTYGDIGWVVAADNPSPDNHFSTGGTFDNWEPAPGYELAFFLSGSGVGGVPEPATWAMMMLGFGAAGGMMRYRRRKTSVSYA